jgi:hypothetical protein
MLCNEVASTRMQRACEERGEYEVYKGLPSEIGDQQVVHEELGKDVEVM